MFVVLEIKDGICYFELPGIDKYSQVAVVSITPVKQDDTDEDDNIEDETGEE